MPSFKSDDASDDLRGRFWWLVWQIWHEGFCMAVNPYEGFLLLGEFQARSVGVGSSLQGPIANLLLSSLMRAEVSLNS